MVLHPRCVRGPLVAEVPDCHECTIIRWWTFLCLAGSPRTGSRDTVADRGKDEGSQRPRSLTQTAGKGQTLYFSLLVFHWICKHPHSRVADVKMEPIGKGTAVSSLLHGRWEDYLSSCATQGSLASLNLSALSPPESMKCAPSDAFLLEGDHVLQNFVWEPELFQRSAAEVEEVDRTFGKLRLSRVFASGRRPDWFSGDEFFEPSILLNASVFSHLGKRRTSSQLGRTRFRLEMRALRRHPDCDR